MPIKNNIFESIQQLFKETLSIFEPTAKIPSSDILVCLVFHFFGQAKDSNSLESIRRELLAQTNTSIKRSSFSERLNTEKLNLLLSEILVRLSHRFLKLPLRGRKLCKILKVDDILLLDSLLSQLPKEAKTHFPGVSTEASLKHHVCLSLLSGYFPWNDFSEGSSSDQNHFPFLTLLKNKLILFDLGYYDFSRFQQIEQAGGFYFSRSKEGSALETVQIKEGLPLYCLGKKLSDLENAKYFKQEIDLVVEGKRNKETYRFRVVGFYNKRERKYHFYVTNLKMKAKQLRRLYNLRWQVELFFKSSKQSLGMKKYSTSKFKIIMNLMLASMIAQMLGMYMFQEGCEEKATEEEKLGISFQRVYFILNLLAKDFKEYILSAFERKPVIPFEEKFKLFLLEISDPDKKRKNSLQLLAFLI